VEGFECTITVDYSPFCYGLVDTFMSDSESISDNDRAWDTVINPELCIRGRLSLSPAFGPSIEVSIYPSLEATTPFSESELNSIGVQMKMTYTDSVWNTYIMPIFAERLGPAARHRALEALDQTRGLAELGFIAHSEPILPPGWERRLTDVDSPRWQRGRPTAQSYFIHPESGKTSPFPPSLDPTPGGTGDFYYLILTKFALIVLQRMICRLSVTPMRTKQERI
jgi:hypothetical protein